jgi:hypothetical protein
VEVEPIEPRRKITRQSVLEAINKALPKLKKRAYMYSLRYVLFVEEMPRVSHWTRYGHFDRYNTSVMCTTFSGLVLKYIEL